MQVLGCTQLPEFWETSGQSKLRRLMNSDIGYYLKLDIKEKMQGTV